MKNRYFLIIFILIFVSCNRKQNNIICQIDGLKNDTVLIGFIQESNRDKEIIDTLITNDGVLNYNFPVTELYEGIIIPFDLIYKFDNGKSFPLPSSRIRFFLSEDENIEINALIKNNYIDYIATGNKLSEQISVARKMKLPLFKESIDYTFEYNKNEGIDRTEAEEKTYLKKRNKNNIEYTKQNIKFIKTHPKSEYSARLLLEIQDKNIASSLYDELNDNVKHSFFGKIMNDMIHGWAITTPGIRFPEFNANTLTGDELSLENHLGKYVVLDFWGSWCTPCLSEIPEIKDIYTKYRDQLFIVGVACNDNLERLLETIEQNDIKWPQVIEGKERDTKYSQLFGISSYPTKILLDREGNVIKSYLGTDKLFFKDIKKLLNE